MSAGLFLSLSVFQVNVLASCMNLFDVDSAGGRSSSPGKTFREAPRGPDRGAEPMLLTGNKHQELKY